MVYSGFENRALEPGQEYVFFILAELYTTGGVFKMINLYLHVKVHPTHN